MSILGKTKLSGLPKKPKRPWKCKECGRLLVVDKNSVSTGGVVVCSKCMRTLYDKCSTCGISFPKKSLVTCDDGKLACSVHAASYVCCITGKQFYSRQPIIVTLPKDLIKKGGSVKPNIVNEDVEYNYGLDHVFAVVSKDGLEEYSKDKALSVCPICGFLTDISKGPAAEFGKQPLRDARFSGTRGLRPNTVYQTCPVCFYSSLPVTYDGITELKGKGNTIGYEFELEPTVQSQLAMYKWRDEASGMIPYVFGATDNSLRGPFPVEYKSPILHEDNFEWWLKEFCSRLDARVFNRYGLHIHIGTADYSWSEMNRLMVYLKHHEKAFCSMVSPSRTPTESPDPSGRPLALPPSFADIHKTKDSLLSNLYGPDYKTKLWRQGTLRLLNRRANDQDGPKYSGCIHRYQWANVHGHFNKRAIEIRLHQGTTNMVKAAMWGRLWLSVIRMAKTGVMNPPLELVDDDVAAYFQSRIRALSNLKVGQAEERVHREARAMYNMINTPTFGRHHHDAPEEPDTTGIVEENVVTTTTGGFTFATPMGGGMTAAEALAGIHEGANGHPATYTRFDGPGAVDNRALREVTTEEATVEDRPARDDQGRITRRTRRAWGGPTPRAHTVSAVVVVPELGHDPSLTVVRSNLMLLKPPGSTGVYAYCSSPTIIESLCRGTATASSMAEGTLRAMETTYKGCYWLFSPNVLQLSMHYESLTFDGTALVPQRRLCNAPTVWPVPRGTILNPVNGYDPDIALLSRGTGFVSMNSFLNGRGFDDGAETRIRPSAVSDGRSNAVMRALTHGPLERYIMLGSQIVPNPRAATRARHAAR